MPTLIIALYTDCYNHCDRFEILGPKIGDVHIYCSKTWDFSNFQHVKTIKDINFE